MWIYKQSTGELSLSGAVMGRGYSGMGLGKNNPDMEGVKAVGPIPEGVYTIGDSHNLPHFGPLVMILTASTSNAMFNRTGFMIHADNPAHPGQSSEGCIVLPLSVRSLLAVSDDRLLEVVR